MKIVCNDFISCLEAVNHSHTTTQCQYCRHTTCTVTEPRVWYMYAAVYPCPRHSAFCYLISWMEPGDKATRLLWVYSWSRCRQLECHDHVAISRMQDCKMQVCKSATLTKSRSRFAKIRKCKNVGWKILLREKCKMEWPFWATVPPPTKKLSTVQLAIRKADVKHQPTRFTCGETRVHPTLADTDW